MRKYFLGEYVETRIVKDERGQPIGSFGVHHEAHYEFPDWGPFVEFDRSDLEWMLPFEKLGLGRIVRT